MKTLRFCACALGLLPALVCAGDVPDAEAVMEKAVNSVLTVLRDGDLRRAVKRERILAVVRPTFDLPLMARLALGREHWPTLSEDERKEFVELFVLQLENSYFDKAQRFASEAMRFHPPQTVKNKVHIKTTIQAKDEEIAIVYKLYKSKAGWRVYDLEIQGVSIVSSYRSQYSQALREGTFADLLSAMREKGRIAEAGPTGDPAE